MRNRAMILFVGLILAAAVSSAGTINFTADEGYSGDGASWASRLSAQIPTTGTNWVESRAGSTGRFRVDSSGEGLLTLDGLAGYDRAIYQEALLTTNQTYQIGVKFTFNRATNQISNQAVVMAVGFTDAASGGNTVTLKFERQPNANSGVYMLRFWSNTGATTWGTYGWSDESDWGFVDSDDATSDELWLGLTFYRGADTSSWMVSGIVSNMNTGVAKVMPTNTIGVFATSSSFFTDPLYGEINSSDADVNVNVSNRTVRLFAIGEPDFGVPPSTIETDFTAAEGYQDGQLNATCDWSGHSNFTVDSTAGTVIPDGTVSLRRVIYNQNMGSADQYTVGIKCSFNRIDTAISGSQEVIGVELGDTLSTSLDYVAMRIRRAGWNSALYQLGYYENSGGASTYGYGSGIDESLLGFGDGDDQSDDLWLSMTLIRGTNSSSWVVSGVLSNLTTEAEIGVFDPVTIDLASTFYEGNVYGVINSMALESDSQVSNRVIDAFYLAAESTTPQSFADWINDFALSGDDTLADADPDGDGYSNIQEYGLGGNPTTASDSLHIPTGAVNGNLFELVHVALTNSASGIDYLVETTTNLVSGTWTNIGITTISGSFAEDASFNSVTNRISMDGIPTGFMRLRIVEQ